MSLHTEAMSRLTRRLSGRLDTEIRGAWRAGYPFLYVVTTPQTPDDPVPEYEAIPMPVRLRAESFPAHVRAVEYDLRDVDDPREGPP